MQDKLKFLGAILILLGVFIISTSLLIGRFIPGGIASLAIGIILILSSRK